MQIFVVIIVQIFKIVKRLWYWFVAYKLLAFWKGIAILIKGFVDKIFYVKIFLLQKYLPKTTYEVQARTQNVWSFQLMSSKHQLKTYLKVDRSHLQKCIMVYYKFEKFDQLFFKTVAICLKATLNMKFTTWTCWTIKSYTLLDPVWRPKKPMSVYPVIWYHQKELFSNWRKWKTRK